MIGLEQKRPEHTEACKCCDAMTRGAYENEPLFATRRAVLYFWVPATVVAVLLAALAYMNMPGRLEITSGWFETPAAEDRE